MKIYIVQAQTGEYSDHREWIVQAFRTEEAAKNRVIQLEALMKLYGVDKYVDWETERAGTQSVREDENGDPNFDIDYTGTSYYYVSCELIEE